MIFTDRKRTIRGRRLRIGHLTTVDASLFFLLRTELEEDGLLGHDVVGLSAPGPWVTSLEQLGIRHAPIASFSRSWDVKADLRAAMELYRSLRALDLDILHTHTPKAGVLGRVTGRLCRIPIVVNTCHGLPFTEADRRLKRMAVIAIEAAAAQFSDGELFLNSDDFRTMYRFVRRRHPRVIGNGTDLVRFRFDPEGRERVRAELQLAPDDVLVGAVGRRVAEKGMFEFSQAAQLLANQATFVWAGPEDPDKPDHVGEPLAGVRFLGERLDMPAVYSALDVFVLPSHREGFPRSAMEAAACGRSMVLTDIRGSREIGTDGVEALFVPPKDATRLAVAIEELISNAELRLNLGSSARLKAQSDFDQRAMAKRSFQVYESVANRKGLDLGAFASNKRSDRDLPTPPARPTTAAGRLLRVGPRGGQK